MPIEVVETGGLSRVVALPGLGRAHGLSAYDAAYLDLAMREGVPLATRDAALRTEARGKGVAILAID